jgi:hypothetical protein
MSGQMSVSRSQVSKRESWETERNAPITLAPFDRIADQKTDAMPCRNRPPKEPPY